MLRALLSSCSISPTGCESVSSSFECFRQLSKIHVLQVSTFFDASGTVSFSGRLRLRSFSTVFDGGAAAAAAGDDGSVDVAAATEVGDVAVLVVGECAAFAADDGVGCSVAEVLSCIFDLMTNLKAACCFCENMEEWKQAVQEGTLRENLYGV